MSLKKRKHLIVDGQIFQSAARDRGMGRYSEYFLSAMLEEDVYEEVHIIFSKKSHAPGIGKFELDTLFAGTKKVYLDLSSTARQRIEGAERHNKKVVNAYIASLGASAASVDFLIPSPFQEPIVSVFPDQTNNFVIFYDLIPYLYHKRYADKMPFENYLHRFKLLFQADKLLTISQAVRDDLALYLGLPFSKTEVIDGAAIKSHKAPVPPSGLILPKRFILMPTSDDPRKNNLRAVLGFEEFNSKLSEEYKLIITSKIHKTERERLQRFSKNIIFTGNIAEAELDWLYERADVVLFTPESEGLGLPILEAVQVGKRVVCSSLDVFREISGDAFYFCDHEDQYSIATALGNAVADRDKSIAKREYARILKHYSWPGTAKRAIDAIAKTRKVLHGDRPRVAVFTPAPDGFSAVGKVVAETHAVLSEYFDVDYYAEPGRVKACTRPNFLRYVANYYPAESFSVKSYSNYQAVFYHIGNSEYHLQSIANSLYLPGYVILHDTNITDAYRVMVDEDMISKQRSELEAQITAVGKLKLSKNLASVITNQQGVITHSDYAVSAVEEVLRGRRARVRKVNLATQVPQSIPIRGYGKLRLGLAGIIADIKGIEVIEKLAKDMKYQSHTIAIFGYNYASQDTIERLQSYDNVSLTTNLTDFDFANSMRKLDVFVNYRMQYQGETSLSTLEAMRQGVAVVVRNIGWYAELPDDVVVKVDSPEELEEKLRELIDDPDRLAGISKRAADYVKKHHSHEQYAEGMFQIMTSKESVDKEILHRSEELHAGRVTSISDLLRIEE